MIRLANGWTITPWTVDADHGPYWIHNQHGVYVAHAETIEQATALAQKIEV